MRYTIEIEVTDVHGDGSWWEVTATGLDRSASDSDDDMRIAIRNAVSELADDVEGDSQGTSDRAEAVGGACAWLANWCVPQDECRQCLEHAPTEDFTAGPDGTQWCSTCIDDLADDLVADELWRDAEKHARELEYDRQEERGVEAWRESRRGMA